MNAKQNSVMNKIGTAVVQQGICQSVARTAAGWAALAGLAMLVGCGGGGGGASPNAGTVAQQIQVRGPVDTNAFLQLARQDSCASLRNRYIVIDRQFVFRDSAGACADASFSRVLYGANPQQVLCSETDSIGGPRTQCVDEQYRAMFNQVNANRNLAGFGLGSDRQFSSLIQGTPVAARLLERSDNSGIQRESNLVVRDSNAWSTLWQQHFVGSQPVPALPTVDFSQNMVLALFAGAKANGCLGIEKVDVVRTEQAIRVIRTDFAPPSDGQVCTSQIIHPARLLEIPRSDLPVEFVTDPFSV